MDTLYSSEDISFSPIFVEPQETRLMAGSWGWQVCALCSLYVTRGLTPSQIKSTEYATGLNLGEMASFSGSVHETLQGMSSVHGFLLHT